MKRNLITIITALLLFACKTNNSEVIIKGTVLGNKPEEIFYTAILNNTYNEWFKDYILPDSSGRFLIAFEIDQPQFIGLLYKSDFKQLIIEPGQTYEIEINERINQVSDKSSAQKFYENLPDINPLFCDFFNNDISSYIDIYENINETLSKELKELNALNCNEDILNLLKRDREVYYNLVIASLASRNNLAFIHRDQKTPDDIMKMWETATSVSFITNPQSKKAVYLYNLLDLALWYNIYDKFNLNDFRNIRKEKRENKQIHSHTIQLAQDILPNESVEFFTATYIQSVAKQNRYESELITLFSDFKDRYPNSHYTRYIAPEIDKIIDFYTKIETHTNTEIKFIDNHREKNSLAECLATLKGQMIYVDIWSTSWGICKEEFNYLEELKEFLNENEIASLYISIDGDSFDERWKNMIIYYELDGYHVRANNLLKENLRETIGTLAIPRYLIIDENGKMINYDAPRPSNLEKLKEIFKM